MSFIWQRSTTLATAVVTLMAAGAADPALQRIATADTYFKGADALAQPCHDNIMRHSSAAGQAVSLKRRLREEASLLARLSFLARQ